MKNIGTKLAAVAFLAFVASPAYAGKGGSAAKIKDAIRSGSVDAITAEIERAESLTCSECVQAVTNLLEDDRYAVREVAAWWFAKRPGLKDLVAATMVDDLANGSTIKVRNAADFLGRTVTYTSLPTLRVAINRDNIGPEGKLAMVRAVSYMGHIGGNPVLTTAMADRDAGVRAAAVTAWRDILGQTSAAPVAGLLADADANVRAAAATTVGGMGHVAAAAQLETMVVSDADPVVRRNAAWALGKLGQQSSRIALATASTDNSGLVRMTARAALASLK
ncbi:MAG: HEAT repeat domain-containing protein [Deltaproteobacteria bacterium]|nr:HEAT repeat domain-containing protein [Deltaproteobacteria bacterium]